MHNERIGMNRSDNTYQTDKSLLDEIVDKISHIILGKEEAIRLSLTCLLARGHLLIEDLPGMGKTTLSHTLASTLGLEYRRIQFTSDLLPADILGVSIYNRDTDNFIFQAGPIFAQVVMADEINRATPRAQSALLEAMEECQVTIEGKTHNLPEPFFVIATQNPTDQVGTFPLPESQLDRFTMRIRLGYPDSQAEKDLLQGHDRRILLKRNVPAVSVERLKELQAQAQAIHVSAALVAYLQDLLEYSRLHGNFRNGLSPRAGLAVLKCARAWALIHGHPQVLPEDIQKVLPSVIGHRLDASGDGEHINNQNSVVELIKKVPIP